MLLVATRQLLPRNRSNLGAVDGMRFSPTSRPIHRFKTLWFQEVTRSIYIPSMSVSLETVLSTVSDLARNTSTWDSKTFTYIMSTFALRRLRIHVTDEFPSSSHTPLPLCIQGAGCCTDAIC